MSIAVLLICCHSVFPLNYVLSPNVCEDSDSINNDSILILYFFQNLKIDCDQTPSRDISEEIFSLQRVLTEITQVIQDSFS